MSKENTPGAQAMAPCEINHLALIVRNGEVSHRLWAEMVGFRCVAELKPIPGRKRPKMRFYSGLDAEGHVTHHDLALAEVQEAERNGGDREKWDLMPSRTG